MKKIGILTFHRANNYGALLQAYALKKVLSNYCISQIINYKSLAIEDSYRFCSNINKIGIVWIIKKLIKLCFLPIILIINDKYGQFRKKFLEDTKAFKLKNIRECDSDFDVFITGSDQVFNPSITRRDSTYFLDFVTNRKKCYSYAASFGRSDFNKEEKNWIAENLKQFAVVSVREETGGNIVSNLSKANPIVHIDPTLLLKKNEWTEIAKYPKKESYVLLYTMAFNNKIVSYAANLAKQKKIKLYVIFTSIDLKNRIKTPGLAITPTPQEWLGLFLNADYVVTNSFHGLAFSVNFNKPFFVDLLTAKDAPNSRLMNFLELTHLQNRLIDNIQEEYDQPIAWDNVNNILEKERERSLEYLRKIAKSNE